MSTLSPATRQNLLSLFALVGFFALWELACMAFNVSSLILPRPSQVMMVLVTKMPLLWPHTAQTLYTTLVGFGIGVLVGIVLGMLIGSSKLAYNVAYPLLVESTVRFKILPPVVVNVATGLASTEPELEDVLKVLGASKRDLLWNVGLPRALPYLFASLKIAITLAFVGTVLSETVAANRGIGNVMMIASGNFDVPMVFAGLFILAALGISLYAVSSFIEQRMTGWSQRKSEMAMA